MNRSSPILTTPSRRGFLAVLSVGAAATVAPAALAAPLAHLPETASSAIAPPDAGLLELFDQYKAAWSEFGRLIRLQDRMEEKHRVRIPMPEEMFVRPGDAGLGLPAVSKYSPYNSSYWLSIRDLQKPKWPVISAIEPPPPGTKFSYLPDGETIYFAPPSEAACARAAEIIKADKKWQQMQQRARHPALRAAEQQARAASRLADRLRRKIDRTPARTVAGLAAKAQVAAIEGEGDTQFADTTLASIMRDMRALAKIGGQS
jgi:hypothetical protein